MGSTNTVLKKVFKYIFKGLKILLIVLVLVFAVVFIYVSANKKKIIAEVTAEIGKKINGTVTIGDVDLSFFENFPKVAVRLKNIKITDTMYAQHKHTFFEAKEVFLTLSISKLIKKQPPVNGLRIKDAGIYLFTDVNGYTNTYLLKPKTAPSTGTKNTENTNELKTVRLTGVHVVINDLQKEKLHDLSVKEMDVRLDDETEDIKLNTDASILVNSLAFNLAKGSFLKGKTFKADFDMTYNKQQKQLLFDSIDVKLEGQPFNLSGKFDLGKNDPVFTLKLHTRKAGYQIIRSLLPEKISNSLGIVSLDKPIDADAFIQGPLNGGEPLLIANFTVNKSALKTPFLDFEEASFKGFYSNEVIAGLPRKDPNSTITITGFSGQWHGLPMASQKIQILDLTNPLLTADLSSDFPLTQLNELIGSNAIQLQAGDGTVKLKYQGPIVRNNNTNSFLDGTIAFKNGNVLYAPRNVELKAVNGAMIFKNSDLLIQNLQANVLGNSVVMDGVAKNLLTLINTEPNKVNIDWNIFSPSLNLGAFTYLLKSRSNVVANHSSKTKLTDVSDKIDKALEQSTLSVNLKVNRLLYKKFEATNVLASIRLLQDRYNIDNVSMNHAGGKMSMNGSLLNNQGNTHKASVNATVTNVDVQKIFTAFNNFGQDGITAKSLEGNLTAKIDATMQVSDDGAVLPSSISSVVDFSLKNGALNNYEPIKKLQSLVFKNRDFENIRFAELKDRLEISNQDIKINRMEIQSSVLSMFVEGVFSNRGKTDISIQVPLNNLKKRGADYIPENIGTAGKGGRSIFIRGQPGSDGNVKFKLDLFQQYKKDNK